MARLRKTLLEVIAFSMSKLPLRMVKISGRRNLLASLQRYDLVAEGTNPQARVLSQLRGINYAESGFALNRYSRWRPCESLVDLAPYTLLAVPTRKRTARSMVEAGVPVIRGGDPRTMALINSSIARSKLATLQRRNLYRELFEDKKGSYPLISVIVSTNRPEQLNHLRQQFEQQTYPNKELVVLTHGFKSKDALFEPDSSSLGNCLNRLVESARGELIAKFDDDDFYLENYLLDQFLNLWFQEADLVGKCANYIYFEAYDCIAIRRRATSNQVTDFVAGATLLGRRKVFDENPFPDRKSGEDTAFLQSLVGNNARIFSTDPFNFLVNRHGQHTWRMKDEVLLENASIETYGLNLDHVRV